jgi:hypothetical protein
MQSGAGGVVAPSERSPPFDFAALYAKELFLGYRVFRMIRVTRAEHQRIQRIVFDVPFYGDA